MSTLLFDIIHAWNSRLFFTQVKNILKIVNSTVSLYINLYEVGHSGKVYEAQQSELIVFWTRTAGTEMRICLCRSQRGNVKKERKKLSRLRNLRRWMLRREGLVGKNSYTRAHLLVVCMNLCVLCCFILSKKFSNRYSHVFVFTRITWIIYKTAFNKSSFHW